MLSKFFQICERYAISVVSNSIYNVDPKSFEGGESEILSSAQDFLTPTKKTMILFGLWSVYPFLSRFFKFAFAKPDAAKFFYDLMVSSMRQREVSGVKNMDYLEYLIALKNKKEIDGK